MPTAVAVVAIDNPARCAKQLASHLGGRPRSCPDQKATPSSSAEAAASWNASLRRGGPVPASPSSLTAAPVGKDLTQEQAGKAGMAIHHAPAPGTGAALHGRAPPVRDDPFGAGAASGLSMAVLVDEIANPLLGFTPHRRTRS